MRSAQREKCTICVVALWQIKIVCHGIYDKKDSVPRIAMDVRQRKGKWSWGSMQTFALTCKILLCDCGGYMRASPIEIATTYLAHSLDMGCKPC